MKRMKGSITIFSLICILLISAAVFALLEGTRYQEIRRMAHLRAEVVLEAVFSNYSNDMWETYRLLATNRKEGEKIVKDIASKDVKGNKNMLQSKIEDAKMDQYTLLTDGEGKVFIKTVSNYMKTNLLYETGKEIYNHYESIKYLLNVDEVPLSAVDDALDEIKTAQETASQVTTPQVSTPQVTTPQVTTPQEPITPEVDVKQLLEKAKRIKEMGILELVVNDTSKISTKEESFQGGLLERSLEKGTLYGGEELSWADKVLFQQYLKNYMSSYTSADSKRALSYELEYLLAKKNSDVENLKTTIKKLLTIRTTANFLYLISNPEKVAQAETMAIMYVGETLNPAIIEVVKLGLLTAWSYAESILDVRALLDGKKIALLKSEELWTIELSHIGEIVNGFPMAKESIWGLSYENYLGILLLFEEQQELAMRALNLQEATLKSKDQTFQMDQYMVQAEMEMEFSYKRIFPFVKMIGVEKKINPKITVTENYAY